MELTEKQIMAIKCAYADLVGAEQAKDQGDIYAHDWDAHSLTIAELIEAFDFIDG